MKTQECVSEITRLIFLCLTTQNQLFRQKEKLKEQFDFSRIPFNEELRSLCLAVCGSNLFNLLFVVVCLAQIFCCLI